MSENSSCRLVELVLMGVNLNRTAQINESEPLGQMRSTVSADVKNSSLDEDGLYASQVRMLLEIRDRNGETRLLIDIDYDAVFEVSGATEAEALDSLDEQAAEILSPHASHLIADLISRTGLPPFYMQAARLVLPRKRRSATRKQATIQ